MVRLQGDFAKPPEKRLNYKNSLDGLYRVRLCSPSVSFLFEVCLTCCTCHQMVREEGWSSLGRGVGPNVFRAILMNASQLAS